MHRNVKIKTGIAILSREQIFGSRMLILSALCVLLSNPVIAGQGPQNEATLAITGATLIDGTDAPPIENAVVIIHDGYIECAGSQQNCPVSPNTPTLDATGQWLIPGLIDTHIHWQVWYDNEKKLSPQIAARAASIYLANGITTVVDVGGQRWVKQQHRQTLDELQGGEPPTPRMLFSGWIDSEAVDASISKDAGIAASELLSQGVVGIKVHNGLTKNDYERIVAVADQADRPVYGHTYYLGESGFLDFTGEAVVSGIDGVFHVLGIPPVVADKAPPLPTVSMEDWQAWWLAGAELWLHADEESMGKLIEQMVGNGAWLQPTLITEQFMIKPDYYQDHPNWAYSPMTREELQLGFPVFQGEDLANYRAAYLQMQKFVSRFKAAGGMLVAGTDGLPIPGFGMQEELRLLAEAGIPTLAAIQSATRNAAIAWRWQDRIGTVQQGKAADLVILAGDPVVDITQTRNIWRVIKGGVVHDPEILLASEIRTDF